MKSRKNCSDRKYQISVVVLRDKILGDMTKQNEIVPFLSISGGVKGLTVKKIGTKYESTLRTLSFWYG